MSGLTARVAYENCVSFFETEVEPLVASLTPSSVPVAEYATFVRGSGPFELLATIPHGVLPTLQQRYPDAAFAFEAERVPIPETTALERERNPLGTHYAIVVLDFEPYGRHSDTDPDGGPQPPTDSTAGPSETVDQSPSTAHTVGCPAADPVPATTS